MGLFYSYHKFGNGYCHICKKYLKYKEAMKEHITDHYDSGFFKSEEKKRAFIRKNAYRIKLLIKTKEIEFKRIALHFGVTSIPEDNTYCYFCNKPYQERDAKNFICAFCLASVEASITGKECLIFVDGKEYENPHTAELILDVIKNMREEIDQDFAKFKWNKPKKILKQFKLTELLDK